MESFLHLYMGVNIKNAQYLPQKHGSSGMHLMTQNIIRHPHLLPMNNCFFYSFPVKPIIIITRNDNQNTCAFSLTYIYIYTAKQFISVSFEVWPAFILRLIKYIYVYETFSACSRNLIKNEILSYLCQFSEAKLFHYLYHKYILPNCTKD